MWRISLLSLCVLPWTAACSDDGEPVCANVGGCDFRVEDSAAGDLTRDSGIDARADLSNDDARDTVYDTVPDPSDCGAHADNKDGKCTCHQGYLNIDGTWDNGCEAPDPACSSVDCGRCPVGYCGANAVCLFGERCRCLPTWLNQDGDWDDGCEASSPDCSPTSCNECAVGYCGRNANCVANKCVCAVGWSNCDGIWFSEDLTKSGCECLA